MNILLVLLIFLFLSDLYIKNSPKSKLNLVPINYKIKKKDGFSELIFELKIKNCEIFSVIILSEVIDKIRRIKKIRPPLS